jgi:aspartyl-tRNA(Asn)/glutamyl-tRNA(Gln) amidotransferase subunit A
MSGEVISLDRLVRPRLAIPAGWVSGLDQPTEDAWALVSNGVPEIEFVDRDRLFRVGLSILLFEAAAYHRRWASECPEQYGADVLRLIRRGFEITDEEYKEALRERLSLQDAADRAMRDIDALLVPATAIIAPLIDTADEVREPLSRFTRPFNTTHQPVAVLPAPVQGLPVGIQVAGRTNADTLRAAMWLEREWRGSAA